MGSSPSRGGFFGEMWWCWGCVGGWWLYGGCVGGLWVSSKFLKKNDLDGATGSFHVTDKYNPFYEKYSRRMTISLHEKFHPTFNEFHPTVTRYSFHVRFCAKNYVEWAFSRIV